MRLSFAVSGSMPSSSVPDEPLYLRRLLRACPPMFVRRWPLTGVGWFFLFWGGFGGGWGGGFLFFFFFFFFLFSWVSVWGVCTLTLIVNLLAHAAPGR